MFSMSKGDTNQTKTSGCISIHPAGVVWSVVTDGMEQVVFIITVKWRLTNQHLVQQHPKTPPVHRRVVLRALENLYHKIQQHTN